MSVADVSAQDSVEGHDEDLGGNYRMIESFEIRRFRCFKDFNVSGLKQFNFIVGESGIGKTALIEALFLTATSNPEAYFRIRRWRGFGESGIELSGTKDSYEAVFRDIFYRFQQDTTAHIRFSDSHTRERSLRIFYKDEGNYNLPLNKGRAENAFAVDPIHFQWHVAGARVVDGLVELKDGVLKMTGGSGVYPLVLVSPPTMSMRVTAIKYSELSKQKKAGPVVGAIRKIFPYVEDISLESVAGELMLHVSIPGLPEKMPMAVLSAGINKYVTIILAIISNPGGVVLIDEIENGFYYKNQTAMLAGIVELCIEYRVQIIASTHSYELLQALVPVMDGEQADNFTLLRLERGEDEPGVRLIQGQAYKAAVEQAFEVR